MELFMSRLISLNQSTNLLLSRGRGSLNCVNQAGNCSTHPQYSSRSLILIRAMSLRSLIETRLNSSTHFISNIGRLTNIEFAFILAIRAITAATLTSSLPSPHSFRHLHLRSHWRSQYGNDISISSFIFVAPKDHKTSHWLTTYSCKHVRTDLQHEQPYKTWTLLSIFVILFIEFLILPSASVPLSAVIPLHHTLIITPHATIGSISTEHETRLHMSPSSHTIIHIFTNIMPTHDHHSSFWHLISRLHITAWYLCSLLISTHPSSLNNCLTPSSHVSNISHRVSRLSYSVSFSTSIETCYPITPASFSAESLTPFQLSFLHYSHSLSIIISHSFILVTKYFHKTCIDNTIIFSEHTFKTHRTSCITVWIANR